jgi:glycosyltransferase involved in cell wall biosynthesis
MTKVLIAEWLPRGGTTQTSETWRRVGRDAGLEVRIAGRADGHLVPDHQVDRRLPTKAGAVEVHRRLIRAVSEAIRSWDPDVLYVQNYWVPALERSVLLEANRRGIRTVLAMHNAAPHSRLAGSRIGLSALVASADELVVHSRFVAGRVAAGFGRSSTLIELPLPLDLLDAAPIVVPELAELATPRALSFGVVRRRYKGTVLAAQVASRLPVPWEVVIAGAGASAPSGSPVVVVDRFLAPGELRWIVEHSTVSLLPYRTASQSAAVVLAQALGAPPITTAVGGIPEQVEHGRTGLLLPPGTPPEEWVKALVASQESCGAWDTIVSQARTHAHDSHGRASVAWVQFARDSP